MAAGRPREFDLDRVLGSALDVFWAKGYEGTTMADLSTATGLKPGSVYAAFGSKAGLFAQVLDRYEDSVFRYARDAIQEPTVREVIRHWLEGVARATTGPDTPPGCLLVHGALAAGDGAASIRAELAGRRDRGEQFLVARLERARAEGDLPASVDPRAAAGYVFALSSGLAVEAAGGADRGRLLRTVELTLHRLPWE
ncbi:TetR/AcrR family transcriptional regulator [Catellatospora chokoriensis]|uniref:TetR family transcriptional regulator n=1 Tax=Catellatospora chokoriensis TaxID=310353 RepID=A0A8J3JZS1_9ACTN|nr:TetR/AcrR family transcriptional regulator [Catellatospora chokoriensis]GIF86749.1 TetR family transcriptional regulator [Catellatospora chokoriensis]